MANTINIHDNDRVQYRKSLLTVIQSALLNEDRLMGGFPSGGEISDCLDLIKLMEDKGDQDDES